MTDQTYEKITLPVDVLFEPHLASALVRFGYLRPVVQVEAQPGQVTITLPHNNGELSMVAQDFQFCLYREKIYHETLSLRQTIIKGLMS